jgi:hypothetical protein
MAENWPIIFAQETKAYEELKAKRSRAQGEAAQIERTLAEARERAVAQFGTSDPEALEAMARDIDAENERQANEFINSVQKVKQALAATGAAAPRMGG